MASRIHLNKTENETVYDMAYDMDFEVHEDSKLEDVLQQLLVLTLEGKQNLTLKKGKYGMRILGVITSLNETKQTND